METNDLNGRRILLNAEDAEQAVGGADYSYAYPIISEMRARFMELMSALPESAARQQVRNEYWDRVIDICLRYPDACTPQEQAEVIFSFTIGSV